MVHPRGRRSARNRRRLSSSDACRLRRSWPRSTGGTEGRRPWRANFPRCRLPRRQGAPRGAARKQRLPAPALVERPGLRTAPAVAGLLRLMRVPTLRLRGHSLVLPDSLAAADQFLGTNNEHCAPARQGPVKLFIEQIRSERWLPTPRPQIARHRKRMDAIQKVPVAARRRKTDG